MAVGVVGVAPLPAAAPLTGWRQGWVHDPRDKKNYKGAIRVKHDGKVLAVRAYIGTEMLGETEEMTRTDTVPSGCKAH